MSLEANQATRVHSDGHFHSSLQDHPGSAGDDPHHRHHRHHRHSHHLDEFPVEQKTQHPAHATSPLWWSAKQRFACAVLLVGGLWLVIAWAVA